MDLSLRANLRRELRRAVIEMAPHGMRRRFRTRVRQQVGTIAEVDALLARADELFAAGEHEAGTALLESFELVPPFEPTGDPHSAAYRAQQMDLYTELSGRASYETDGERTGHEVDERSTIFPYSTGSLAAVGDELLSVGFLLKVMERLPPSARVLEVGCGWGNLTVHLASLGYRVTAVDINEAFAQLVRRRCDGLAGEVETVVADMAELEVGGPFDAAIFNASLHHSLEHAKVLRRIAGSLSTGGRIYLSEEPIERGFWAAWGLRLDGVSLSSIRRFGWLELGFSRRYFDELATSLGLSVRVFQSGAISGQTRVVVLDRS